MTRTQKRPSAARRAFQFAAAVAFVSLIVGGCSSDIKTITTDCPMGGTPSFAGHTPVTAGTDSGAMAGSTSLPEAAGEAGVGQSGESSGGASGGGGVSASGSGGKASSGGKGGGGNAGGGKGGSGGSGGADNTGGAKPAVCGDAVVTPPEFCDDGRNTDLSYGCSACTTLPPSELNGCQFSNDEGVVICGNAPSASQGGAASVPQQCDACLQSASKPSSCYNCMDYRACYACLRRQGDVLNGNCQDNPDDIQNYPFNHQGYSDFCFNPASKRYQIPTGGRFGNKPRGLACQAVVACALRTGCALPDPLNSPPMFKKCYCGDDPNHGCGPDDTFVPNGPCVHEIENADAQPGAPSALSIAADLGDFSDFGKVSVALAIANQIVTCANDDANPAAPGLRGCRDVCFPNSNGTGGTSGTAGGGGTSGKPGVGGNAGHGGP